MIEPLSKCTFCQKYTESLHLVHHMVQGGVSLACKPCIEDPTKEIHKVPDREAYYVRN